MSERTVMFFAGNTMNYLEFEKLKSQYLRESEWRKNLIEQIKTKHNTELYKLGCLYFGEVFDYGSMSRSLDVSAPNKFRHYHVITLYGRPEWDGYDYSSCVTKSINVFKPEDYKVTPEQIRKRWIDRLQSVFDKKIETCLDKYIEYVHSLSGYDLMAEFEVKYSTIECSELDIEEWVILG